MRIARRALWSWPILSDATVSVDKKVCFGFGVSSLSGNDVCSSDSLLAGRAKQRLAQAEDALRCAESCEPCVGVVDACVGIPRLLNARIPTEASSSRNSLFILLFYHFISNDLPPHAI